MKRMMKLIAVLLLVSITMLSVPVYQLASAADTSKISAYLKQIMSSVEQDSVIDEVYIDLSIDDYDYAQAVTEDGTTVKEIDERISNLDEKSSYEVVKDLVMKKRRALCEYCFERNEGFVDELQIKNGTKYISSLNIILGSYTPEEIYRLEKDERVISIGRDDPEATLVSDINTVYKHPRIDKRLSTLRRRSPPAFPSRWK